METIVVTKKNVYGQEKKEIMSKPKSQIIKESKPQDDKPKKEAKKVEPFEKVLNSFKRLSYDQQIKAVESINTYWENI